MKERLERDASLCLAYLIAHQHEWQPWMLVKGGATKHGNGAVQVPLPLYARVEDQVLVLQKEIQDASRDDAARRQGS